MHQRDDLKDGLLATCFNYSPQSISDCTRVVSSKLTQFRIRKRGTGRYIGTHVIGGKNIQVYDRRKPVIHSPIFIEAFE